MPDSRADPIHTDVTRVTFGFDGKFGDSSWTWDADYNYGLTHHDQLVQQPVSLYRILMALDSVNTPNGPECRVTADGFAGCSLRANPFGGLGPPIRCSRMAACRSIPSASAAFRSRLSYSFGNLDGAAAQCPDRRDPQCLGQLSSTASARARSRSLSATSGARSAATISTSRDSPRTLADDYEIQYGSSFGGIMTVNEGYLETNLPLMKDLPGAHLLEFDIAGRESQYENSALYGVNVCTLPASMAVRSQTLLRARPSR